MRILLIDDHREVRVMLRVGLRLNPNIEVVGEAGSVAKAADLAQHLRPDAIVLDLVLPDAAPQDAFARIRGAAPQSKLVVYSARDSRREWYEEQGAQFFSKATDSANSLVAWLEAEARRPRPPAES